jgi:hypothetical protein
MGFAQNPIQAIDRLMCDNQPLFAEPTCQTATARRIGLGEKQNAQPFW